MIWAIQFDGVPKPLKLNVGRPGVLCWETSEEKCVFCTEGRKGNEVLELQSCR